MEDYVFLGSVSNGLFFFHNLENVELDRRITYNLYKILENNGIITNPDTNLIVYEKSKNTEDEYEWTTIIVQSNKKDKMEDFDKDNLEQLFPILVDNIKKVTDGKIATISYNDNYYNRENKEIELPNVGTIIIISAIEHVFI